MSKKAPIKICKSLAGALVCFEKCIVTQQVHKLYTEATVPNLRLLFACQLLILEHRQIYIQPLVDISGEELLHCGKVMIHMIFIKSIVVGKTVCELDIYGRIASLHQFQVHQQTAGATIAVNEGMDSFKFDMETSKLGDDMLCAFRIGGHELFHLRLNHILLLGVYHLCGIVASLSEYFFWQEALSA